MPFTLKRLEEEELTLIDEWLSMPHVSRWFGDKTEWLEEISANLESDWIWYFIARLTAVPVGFVQYYDVKRAPDGPWRSQPEGSVGFDFLIGNEELLGMGYGSFLVENFISYLVKNVKPRRIVADPHPDNVRSHRTLIRNGFTKDEASGLFVLDVPDDPDLFK